MSFKKYTQGQMHKLLCDKLLSNEYWSRNSGTHHIGQALFCPYYAEIHGVLGSDWGVILNPESPKFGQVVFEHDKCGCPADEDGWPLHGTGQQVDDEWIKK